MIFQESIRRVGKIMSMQDPIADLLTRIRNGHKANKKSVKLPFSSIKLAIVKVLQDEGYVEGCKVEEKSAAEKQIEVTLKYYNDEPVITSIDRVSRPGLRVYKAKDSLPRVQGGLGIAIVSTPKGVMSDKRAKELGHGGEVLCVVK